MTIIEIEKIKVSPLKNYDILYSVSFFKMKKSYAKNTLKYYRGLQFHLNYFDRFKEENFIYRIYYDDSLKDDKGWNKLFKEFLKRDYIELFKYHSETLFKNGVHDGTFGTFVRFLPMFDNKKDKKWKIFGCLDVDDKDFGVDRHLFKEANKFKKSDCEFFVNIPKCYYLTPHILSIKEYIKNTPLVVASMFLTKITFDKRIFFNFLNDIENGGKTYQMLKNKLKSFKIINDDRFVYGMDEYFMIVKIAKKVELNNQKICIKTTYTSFMQTMFQILYNNNSFININLKRKLLWKKLLKKILQNEYDNRKSLLENFIILRSKIKCNRNRQSKKICNRVIYEISKIFDNNKQDEYKIPNIVKECVYKTPGKKMI